MMRPTASSHGQYDSEVEFVNVTTGELFPAAPPGSVRLSSVPFAWPGILVELHHLEPQELPEHYVLGHGLSVSTGKRPIPFGWKGGKGWRDGVINPGECHLLTNGERNTPRWLQPFDEVTLVLEPRYIADVVQDGLPPDRVEFATQRSVNDETIARYTEAFRAELAADSPNGSLYAETLTVGFTLHLLSAYAIAKPRIPRPRGKLSSVQLHAVVDFILSHLDKNVSLLALADEAHVSPFHFARKFRATVGVPPHQFVLRQRVQRAICLIRAGKLSLAQIAVESGFHDQPHFIRAFRKVIGTTPATYSAER